MQGGDHGAVIADALAGNLPGGGDHHPPGPGEGPRQPGREIGIGEEAGRGEAKHKLGIDPGQRGERTV